MTPAAGPAKNVPASPPIWQSAGSGRSARSRQRILALLLRALGGVLESVSCPRSGGAGVPYVPIWAVNGLSTRRWAYRMDVEEEVALKDTIMWVTGIVLAVVAAGLMLWSNTSDGPLLVLGMVGILFDRRWRTR